MVGNETVELWGAMPHWTWQARVYNSRKYRNNIIRQLTEVSWDNYAQNFMLQIYSMEILARLNSLTHVHLSFIQLYIPD